MASIVAREFHAQLSSCPIQDVTRAEEWRADAEVRPRLRAMPPYDRDDDDDEEPSEEEEEESEEEFESEDSWESDVDSEAEIAELLQLDLSEHSAVTGKKEYLEKCKELNIVPVAMFIAKLECEHINLRHHGMGIKGALAVAEALRINSKIRSVNLGDNWFGDQGTSALSEVLSANSTLTSINLSENRIGQKGVTALCRRLKENSTLAEMSLKGNALDDRAAKQLSDALMTSTSLTKVDLSYNHFGEEAGRSFGEMLSANGYLIDVNLKWNSLRAKGSAAIAEGLRNNHVLNQIDLGWNGLGDDGAKAVASMMAANDALTHLDIAHNRINLDGALALAEGIKANQQLSSLELGWNPLGIQMNEVSRLEHNLAGVTALVEAMRANDALETVGMANVQSRGSFTRGREPRFDPKNSDGHYQLDLEQPWDHFIAESLYLRMVDEPGEAWINRTLGGAALELPEPGSWTIPDKGVLEFDYVTYKNGLEATFTLDLSNPCDLFLAGEVIRRTTRAAESGEHEEAIRECTLNDQNFDPTSELPAKGMLHLVYASNKRQDELIFDLQLDLSVPNEKVMCLRLWERALTTPSDSWKSAVVGGSSVTLSTWRYPEVPSVGTLALKHAVRLVTKPYAKREPNPHSLDHAPLRRCLPSPRGAGG